VSAGDVFPLTAKIHPYARSFGKPTNGGFTGIDNSVLNFSLADGWSMLYPNYALYLVENPGNYLVRTAPEVDEDVWLEQDDVARGDDTVVKAAIEWIQNLAYAHTATVNKTFVESGIDTVYITAQLKNPNQHQVSLLVDLHNLEDVFLDSLSLFNDGMHGDGNANDSVWGNFYLPLIQESYTVSVTTIESSRQTSRTLPRVAAFTTIGPLKYDGLTYNMLFDTTSHSGNHLKFKINLRNESSEATAADIEAKLESTTPKITLGEATFGFPDITAGRSEESYGYFDVTISSDIHPDTLIYLPITIFGYDYPFWSDSMLIDVISSIKDNPPATLPIVFTLQQNNPNPFNPTTQIIYELPMTNYTELNIFNILGQKIATLVSEEQTAGQFQVQWDATGFASGVYYYQLRAGKFVAVKKMILLK
jgi:hypothetical protein